MIFPEFKGDVHGIWDNKFETWAVDSNGIIHVSTQPEVMHAQCAAMNGDGCPIEKSRLGNSYELEFTVALMASYPSTKNCPKVRPLSAADHPFYASTPCPGV